MKVISPANETVMQMLKTFRKPGTKYRKLKYLVDTEVEDGILLFNVFTRELVLFSKEEFENATENEYLRKNWFIVPEECQEKAYVDLVREFLKARQPKLDEITGYTIFTTTDCNARCFYCFELGRSRIPMSPETALKTAKYIKDHCNGKKVSLSWFGGEPLMNTEAIDIICNYLKAEGIEYKSRMVTNGYLFTDEIIQKAVNDWNLKKVQITLDGTEDIYNKIKAFVYKDVNPYQIVIRNISALLDTDVQLAIRLNMDMHNAEDLLQLTQELSSRFDGKKNLAVYAHHLFKDNIPMAEQHTGEEWDLRVSAMKRIEKTLSEHGLTSKGGITNKLKVTHCMADSGSSITILPDGNIGLCEHHSEDGFIGHIDQGDFDQDVVKAFSETTPQIPECKNCFYYPSCIMLKNCSNSCICYPQYRDSKYRSIQAKICNQHEICKSSKTQTEDIFDENSD